jgi:CRP/FNR family cyclic AMP-dependent transcriptional regulator
VDAEETLRRVPLFEGIQPKHIKGLAKWTTTRSWGPEQQIVREGQSGMGLYCIQTGKVRVSKASPTGEHEIRTMGVGESFGEISLLDDKPRSATVTAIEPTTCVMLDKSQFLAEIRTHPEIALAVLPVIVSWLRDADTKIAQLS